MARILPQQKFTELAVVDEADILGGQVNLIPRDECESQSHAIAKRVRERVRPIAERHGARVKVAEEPLAPPVLQTMVAEIYGPDYNWQIKNALAVRDMFEQTPGVVDVDWYMEAKERGRWKAVAGTIAFGYPATLLCGHALHAA